MFIVVKNDYQQRAYGQLVGHYQSLSDEAYKADVTDRLQAEITRLQLDFGLINVKEVDKTEGGTQIHRIRLGLNTLVEYLVYELAEAETAPVAAPVVDAPTPPKPSKRKQDVAAVITEAQSTPELSAEAVSE